MKGAIGQLMRQAQKMQADMEKAQAELGSLEVTGEAGGGMVRVTMNGRHEVRQVVIDDSLVGDDKEMLEDLMAAACNDAVRRVDDMVKEKMANVTTGMSLPPGFKMPM